MIVQLTCDQVAENWDSIKPCIAEALPPVVDANNEFVTENVLEAILVEKMQCWLSYREVDGGIEIVGFATTTILWDECSRTSSLLLYTLFGIKPLVAQDWVEAWSAIQKYAIAKKCTRIVAYSQNDEIIRNAIAVGAEIQTFISWNLRKEV